VKESLKQKRELNWKLITEIWEEKSPTLQVVEDVMDHVAEDKVVKGEVPETTNQQVAQGAVRLWKLSLYLTE
jgi:hypothetical protein